MFLKKIFLKSFCILTLEGHIVVRSWLVVISYMVRFITYVYTQLINGISTYCESEMLLWFDSATETPIP
jgi:hypothetical protein